MIGERDAIGMRPRGHPIATLSERLASASWALSAHLSWKQRPECTNGTQICDSWARRPRIPSAGVLLERDAASCCWLPILLAIKRRVWRTSALILLLIVSGGYRQDTIPHACLSGPLSRPLCGLPGLFGSLFPHFLVYFFATFFQAPATAASLLLMLGKGTRQHEWLSHSPPPTRMSSRHCPAACGCDQRCPQRALVFRMRQWFKMEPLKQTEASRLYKQRRLNPVVKKDETLPRSVRCRLLDRQRIGI